MKPGDRIPATLVYTGREQPRAAQSAVDSLVRPAFLPVLELADQYKDRWRAKDETYWLARLMQEVGELASATVGDHKDPPEHELRQIASICMNWLDRFYV